MWSTLSRSITTIAILSSPSFCTQITYTGYHSGLEISQTCVARTGECCVPLDINIDDNNHIWFLPEQVKFTKLNYHVQWIVVYTKSSGPGSGPNCEGRPYVEEGHGFSEEDQIFDDRDGRLLFIGASVSSGWCWNDWFLSCRWWLDCRVEACCAVSDFHRYWISRVWRDEKWQFDIQKSLGWIDYWDSVFEIRQLTDHLVKLYGQCEYRCRWQI